MRRRWRRGTLFLFLAAGAIMVAMFARVGYRSLGWGGYVYIDIAVPWKR